MNSKPPLLIRICAISIVSVLAIITGSTKVNATALNFQTVGTHPQALANGYGGAIKELQIFNGKLYSGYGDWNINTGPIHINPFNISTQSFEGSILNVPTEAIYNLRTINGKLYAPTIDPTCGGSCAAGYSVVSQDGTATMELPITAEHIFDIATLNGTDLWLFGSTGGDTATAWRSIDGGDTWGIVQSFSNEPGSNNNERYYWGAVLNGSMYMQSQYGGYQNPLQSFNGTAWNDQYLENGFFCETSTNPMSVVVFESKVTCVYGTMAVPTGLGARFGGLSTYGGGVSGENLPQVTRLNYKDNTLQAFKNCFSYDLATVGEYLYVLCLDTSGGGTKIIRTTNYKDWHIFDNVPNSARSIAIDEGSNKVYIGTENSTIMESAISGMDNMPPSASITSPEANAVVGPEFTIQTNVNDDSGVSRVEFYIDDSLITTKGSDFGQHTFTNTYINGEWTIAPGNHQLKVVAYDTAGNLAESQTVAIFLKSVPELQFNTYDLSPITPGSFMQIVKDSDGDIWFTHRPSSGGVNQIGELNARTGEITYHDLPAGVTPRGTEGSMVIDENGIIWFSSCYATNKLISYDPNTGVVAQYITNSCFDNITLLVDSSGTLWFVSRNSRNVYKIANDGTVTTITTPSSQITFTAAAIDNQGKIALTVRNATVSNNHVYSLATIDDSNVIVTKIASLGYIIDESIDFDSAGNIWASTLSAEAHIIKITPEGTVTVYNNLGLGNDRVKWLEVTSGDSIWFVSESLSTVGVFDSRNSSYQHFHLFDDPSMQNSRYKNLIAVDSNGAWFSDAQSNKIYRVSMTQNTIIGSLASSGINRPLILSVSLLVIMFTFSATVVRLISKSNSAR